MQKSSRDIYKFWRGAATGVCAQMIATAISNIAAQDFSPAVRNLVPVAIGAAMVIFSTYRWLSVVPQEPTNPERPGPSGNNLG